jgi:hypothetical protein
VRILALSSLFAVLGCTALSGFDDLDKSEADAATSNVDGDVPRDTLDELDGADAGDDIIAPADASDTMVTSDAPVDTTTPPDATVTCPTGLKGPSMVSIDGTYCIDSTEVTNAQYMEFITAKGSDTSGQPDYCKWNASWTPGLFWPTDATSKPNNPVLAVDWCDAYGYCKWAGKRLCGQIGGGMTPVASFVDTDKDQWFRACTQNGAKVYPYGSTYVASSCQGADRAGMKGFSVAVGSLGSCVGGYDGLHDMSGNAFEWTDCCTAQSGNGDRCRVRGGSYYASSTYMKCSADLLDATTQRDVQYKDVGFRCCYDGK